MSDRLEPTMVSYTSRGSCISLAVLIVMTAISANAMPIEIAYQIDSIFDEPALMQPQLPYGQYHRGLSECFAGQPNCTVVAPTGTIRFVSDVAAGTATLDLSGVVTQPLPLAAPFGNGDLAINLFRSLDGATGTLVGRGGTNFAWAFVLTGSVVIVQESQFGSLSIEGGDDSAFLDGPTRWLDLYASYVATPEPSTALLLGAGLALLARKRRVC